MSFYNCDYLTMSPRSQKVHRLALNMTHDELLKETQEEAKRQVIVAKKQKELDIEKMMRIFKSLPVDLMKIYMEYMINIYNGAVNDEKKKP